MTNFKISVVIPNYNGRHLLEKNLPKVIVALKDYDAEIIIVDDCSEDGSWEYLERVKSEKLKAKSYILKFKIIKNDRNFGFATTVNRGVEEAMGDAVVLLNTDVAPEKDFLKHTFPFFEDPNVFAVGFMDKSVEDGRIVLRGRGLLRWEKGFYLHRRGKINSRTTDWVSAGSGAFRKKIWTELGGMDEKFNPFYWEDIDLSFRAVQAGYKIIFEPKSIVVHHHETGAIKSGFSADKIKVIAYRNQFIFTWKHLDFGRFISHLLYLPYHFATRLKSKDTAFFQGFFQALLLFGKILK